LLRAQNFGSGLMSMGLSPGVHSMVGIYARNCPEWVIAEQVGTSGLHPCQGLYCYSMVNVPLYDSLGPEARSFVISECEMRIVVAFDEVSPQHGAPLPTRSLQANVRSILSSAPACLKVTIPPLPSLGLQVIVTVRDVKPRLVAEADSLGLKVVR
jgi:long-subunit acyl-CoA synthetase (AMP-forming)